MDKAKATIRGFFSIVKPWSVVNLILIAGIVFVIGGLALLILSLFVPPALLYAIPVFVIGIVILVTLRKQEEVEPIRKRKK